MSELVEVYSIVVYSNKYPDKSIKGGQLYGAILGNDCGDSTFFRADGGRSDDYILPDGTLSLSGPHHCNHGDNWCFRIKLFLKKGDDVLELCHGALSFCHLGYTPYQNKHLIGCVPGRDGYALVNLVTYRSAVQATLEISLKDDDTGSSTAFYGHVRATHNEQNYMNAYEKKYFQTTMFIASKHNPCFCEDGKLPLSRPVTAVPYMARLYIELELYDSKTNTLVVSDKLSFLAEKHDEQIREIACFHVKVTLAEHCQFCPWNPWMI